jgi:hypothetical protein
MMQAMTLTVAFPRRPFPSDYQNASAEDLK